MLGSASISMRYKPSKFKWNDETVCPGNRGAGTFTGSRFRVAAQRFHPYQIAAPQRTNAIPAFVLRCKEMRPQECWGARAVSVTTATSAAAPSATGVPTGRARRGPCTCSRENRQLNRGFLAGALRAGNFLLLVDHDFFEALIAVVTNVFVDRHFEPFSRQRLRVRGAKLNYIKRLSSHVPAPEQGATKQKRP